MPQWFTRKELRLPDFNKQYQLNRCMQGSSTTMD